MKATLNEERQWVYQLCPDSGHWEQLCNIVHCNKQRPASIVYDLHPDSAVQWGLMAAGRLRHEPSSFLGCDNYLHEGTKQGDSVKGQGH